jgi:hypothetical protein
MDLDKVIHLFESKHTSALSDRHLAAIQQLCAEKLGNSSTSELEFGVKGFYYKDLP